MSIVGTVPPPTDARYTPDDTPDPSAPPAPETNPLIGTLTDAQQVRNMLKRIAAKAGLEKRVHPRGLRHAHAAEFVREGTPVNVIRD
jgi:integrase